MDTTTEWLDEQIKRVDSMSSEELLYALKIELEQLLTRMDGKYKNLLTTDEEKRTRILLSAVNAWD